MKWAVIDGIWSSLRETNYLQAPWSLPTRLLALWSPLERSTVHLLPIFPSFPTITYIVQQVSQKPTSSDPKSTITITIFPANPAHPLILHNLLFLLAHCAQKAQKWMPDQSVWLQKFFMAPPSGRDVTARPFFLGGFSRRPGKFKDLWFCDTFAAKREEKEVENNNGISFYRRFPAKWKRP